MHTPTSSTHPPDALPHPQPNRRSYLDEDGYGFTPAPNVAGGGKHAYHDPYVGGSTAGGDPSWVRAPDYPPPAEDNAYDLGQQRGQLLSAAGGRDGPAYRGAHSDVGSSASLGPDDSASVYRTAPYNAGGDQQGYYRPPSHLSYVPEEEAYQNRPLSSYNDRAGLVDGAQAFAGHPAADGYRHNEQGQQQGYAHGGLDGEAEDAWHGKGQRFGDLGRSLSSLVRQRDCYAYASLPGQAN